MKHLKSLKMVIIIYILIFTMSNRGFLHWKLSSQTTKRHRTPCCSKRSMPQTGKTWVDHGKTSDFVWTAFFHIFPMKSKGRQQYQELDISRHPVVSKPLHSTIFNSFHQWQHLVFGNLLVLDHCNLLFHSEISFCFPVSHLEFHKQRLPLLSVIVWANE